MGDYQSIEFVNKCNCIVDYSELEKAINWYTQRPVRKRKAIFLSNYNYPMVRICSEKIAVHRLLMMYWMGRKLEKDEHVHHKNHDKKCALKENLETIDPSTHLSLHKKGITFSEEHKRKIGENSKKLKGRVYKYKSCSVEGCENRARAKGMCSHHYGKERYLTHIKKNKQEAKNRNMGVS